LIKSDAETKTQQVPQVTVQFDVTAHVGFPESQKTIGYDVPGGVWRFEPQGHGAGKGRISVAYPLAIPELEGEIGLGLRLMHFGCNLFKSPFHLPPSFLTEPSRALHHRWSI
jgi:hypothetical protein